MLKKIKKIIQILILLQGVTVFVGGLILLRGYRLEFVQEIISVRYWPMFVGTGLGITFFLLCLGVWAQFQNDDEQSWYVRLANRLGFITASNVLYWGVRLAENITRQTGLVLELGWLTIYDQSIIDQKRKFYLKALVEVHNLALSLLQVPSQVDHLQKLSLQELSTGLSLQELASQTLQELTQQATYTARQSIMEHMQSAPAMTLVEKIKFVYLSNLVQWVTDHPIWVSLGLGFGLGLLGLGSSVAVNWVYHTLGSKLYSIVVGKLYAFLVPVFSQGLVNAIDYQLVVMPDQDGWWWGLVYQISTLVTTLIASGRLSEGGIFWEVSRVFRKSIANNNLIDAAREPVMRAIYFIVECIETSSTNRRRMRYQIFHLVRQQLCWWWDR